MTLRSIFGTSAPPLRWPCRVRQQVVLVPMLVLAVVVGTVSAVVSAPLWLPAVLLALAPVALAASCWVGGW